MMKLLSIISRMRIQGIPGRLVQAAGIEANLVIEASQFVRRETSSIKTKAKIWQILQRSLCFAEKAS